MNKTERKTKRTPAGDEASSPEPQGGELLGLDEIKELIELVAGKQFNEFELQRGSFRLRLLRGVPVNESGQNAPAESPTSQPPAYPVPAPVPVSAQVEEELHIVTSPIVGTYYNAPSPKSEPFISLGDTITAGQTLCIIEAMKLMNEIQSDVSGTVARIFIESSQPVEFGQPLFGIKT